MNREGSARLDFIQNVVRHGAAWHSYARGLVQPPHFFPYISLQSFKFIELLSVNFSRSIDDVIRQQVAFRYNSQKSKCAVLQARLHDVVNVVKVKNPSLLLQLQRPATSTAGSSAPATRGPSAAGGR